MALWLSAYAFPLYDDYGFQNSSHTYGLVGGVIKWWRGWTGRWLCITLSLTFSATPGFLDGSYWWIPPIFMGISFAAVLVFLRQMLPAGTSIASIVSGSLLLCALCWAGARNLGQFFYWIPGMDEYQLGPAMLALLLACVAALARRPSRPLAAAACLLAFLLPGLHEIYGIYTLFVLGMACVLAWKDGHPARRLLLTALACGAAGFLLVYLAPGNGARSGHAPNHGQLLLALRLAGSQAWDCLHVWVADIRLLLATALLMTSPRWNAGSPSWYVGHPRRWHWLVPVTCFVFLGVGFWASPWALGRPAPSRLVDSLRVVFLMGWFGSFYVWTRGSSWTPPKIVTLSVSCLLCLALLGTGNFRLAVVELRQALPAYREDMYERIRLLKQAAGDRTRTVRLPPLRHKPMSVMLEAKLPAKGSWHYICMARAYQVGSVLPEEESK